jgi:hypothetical protein
MSLAGLTGLELAPPNAYIVKPLPVIMKPRESRTGKQVYIYIYHLYIHLHTIALTLIALKLIY